MILKRNLVTVAMVLGTLSAPSIAHADESLWIYTTGAETLPGGETEIKISDVLRTGKADSDYDFHDIRLEVEHGVTDRLTIFGELVVYDHDFSTTNPDLQPFFDTQGGAGGRVNETNLAGYEVGLKYNLTSPYSNPVGVALSLSWEHRDHYRLDGSDIDQNSIDVQAHFQANFLDDTLTVAFSPKIEYETRNSPGILEREISLDIAAGVSYRLAPRFNVGVEFRHQSDYLSPFDTVAQEFVDPTQRPSHFPFDFGSQYQNGNYIGPTIHYSVERMWATLGILWQVSGGGSTAFNRNGLNVDEHERMHVGLILGFEL